MKIWGRIGEQDLVIVGVIQKQQRARDQLGMPTRFSAHWESAVHRFQKQLVEKLQ
jgi:hypothetical protein